MAWHCCALNCPTHSHAGHRCQGRIWFCRRAQPACPGHSRPEHRCSTGTTWHCGAVKCRRHARPEDACASGTWYCGRRQPACPGHHSRDHRCEAGAAPLAPAWVATQKLQLTQIGQVPIWSTRGEAAIFFKSKLAVDADGCPNAYAPRGSGLPALDDLGNGGRPGNWWALVTDNGEDNGTPIVQSRERGDPFPGFYISHTPLKDRRFGARDPRRYVDANTVNYIALPYHAFRRNLIATQRPAYGDVAAVVYHGRLAFAIYADARNDQDIGEGSIALARALRIPSSPVNGGTSARTVVHVVFARSGTGRPLPQAEIDRLGWDHFDRWGGFARLRTYFPEQIIPPLRVGS